MSQFSEHDYSTLECLLNHSWANKRWGEQLPRKIPIDTLGSMVEASDGSTGLRGPHLQRDYRMPDDDIEFDIKNLPAMPWDLTSTTFNDIPQQVEYLTPSTYTATKKKDDYKLPAPTTTLATPAPERALNEPVSRLETSSIFSAPISSTSTQLQREMQRKGEKMREREFKAKEKQAARDAKEKEQKEKKSKQREREIDRSEGTGVRALAGDEAFGSAVVHAPCRRVPPGGPLFRPRDKARQPRPYSFVRPPKPLHVPRAPPPAPPPAPAPLVLEGWWLYNSEEGPGMSAFIRPSDLDAGSRLAGFEQNMPVARRFPTWITPTRVDIENCIAATANGTRYVLLAPAADYADFLAQPPPPPPPPHAFSDGELAASAMEVIMERELSTFGVPGASSRWLELRGAMGTISQPIRARHAHVISQTPVIYLSPTVSQTHTTKRYRRRSQTWHNTMRSEKQRPSSRGIIILQPCRAEKPNTSVAGAGMIILTAIFGYIAHAINYLWHISHSAWNKLMHALHGNGVINRIYTAGMPTLKSNSTIEDYVSWHIDFTAWTKGQGAYGCIIEAPARPADADAQAKDEQEGLRYLAAALEDIDIRTAVMTGAGNSGVNGFRFLRELMLQGSNLQSSIQTTIEGMAYEVGQSPMTFKLRFMKFASSLEPKPSDRILTSKFADALRRNTDSLYDDCISAAGAAGKDDNFDEYSNLLVKLVTQKQSRPGIKNEGDVAALQTMVKDLTREVKQLRNGPRQPTGNPPGNLSGKNGGGGPRSDAKREKFCSRCGKKGHLKADCRLASQCCPFVFPNGEKCQRDHVIGTCFYKDPSLCRDPKMRKIVESKLEKKSTTAAGHKTTAHHEDDDYEEDEKGHTTIIVETPPAPTVNAHISALSEHTGSLIIDSGASDHIVNDPRCLVRLHEHKPSTVTVVTGTGTTRVHSKGPAEFNLTDKNGEPYTIEREVLFAPGFDANLFSTMKDWKTHGTIVEFDARCTLQFSDGRSVPFSIKSKLYTLPYTASVGAYTSTTELYHERMGHQSYRRLSHLPEVTRDPKLQALTLEVPPKEQICPICPAASMKNANHAKRKEAPRSVCEFGDTVSMDLAGPLPPSKPHGFRYCDVFTDHHSLYVHGYAIRSKDDHVKSHKSYISDLADYGGLEIKHFHSDNGGEFTSKVYCEMIADSHARKTTSIAYHPQMNTVSESTFWRIFSIMRAMHYESGIPPEYWPYSFYLAMWIMNRTPRLKDKRWTTPYELVTKTKPNHARLRKFGCRAYCLIEKHQRDGKLGAICDVGWHLGIARHQIGWYVLVPATGKVIVARTVRFDESTVYKFDAAPPAPISAPDAEDDDDDEPAPAPAPAPAVVRPGICRTPGCAQRIFHDGLCGPAPTVGGSGLPSSRTRSAAHFSTTGGVLPFSTDPEQQNDDHGMCYEQYVALKAAGFENEEAIMLATATKAKKQKRITSKVIHDSEGKTSVQPIPRNHHEAIKGHNAGDWKQAMETELAAHSENGTWELVPLDEAKGRKLVGSTWSFDLKRNQDGSISRYKARLCAQGFSQIPGVDYSFTYSNTVRHETVKFLLAFAAEHGWRLTTGDIKTAYLYGILPEVIFMKQPPLFEQFDQYGSPFVCKLIKSIYGLRQSGACWEQQLASTLLALGCLRSEQDLCFWKYITTEGTVLMAVYVDDLIIASSNDTIFKTFTKLLQEKFTITGLGPLTWILGTRVCQSEDLHTVTLDQELYITELVNAYELGEAPKGRSTPGDPTLLELSPLEDGELIDPDYHPLMGKLIWLAVMTRFDISFCVMFLSRFASRGGARHMVEAKKVVRYLGATKEMKITYSTAPNDSLTALISENSKFDTEKADLGKIVTMSDSSFGGERPPAGYVVYYRPVNGPLLGISFRPPFTPLSSAEGEYLAATRAVIGTISIREIAKFAGIVLDQPSIICCDNLAAVQLSDSDTSSKRMKHIATRIAFLRERVGEGDVILYHVIAAGMIADIFTKPLGTKLFQLFRKYLLN